MNKLFVTIGKFLGSTFNILFNPFYTIMSITQRKKDHDENENKLSFKLSKFFRSSYMIFFISAIITVLIVFLLHHKEILGV